MRAKNMNRKVKSLTDKELLKKNEEKKRLNLLKFGWSSILIGVIVFCFTCYYIYAIKGLNVWSAGFNEYRLFIYFFIFFPIYCLDHKWSNESFKLEKNFSFYDNWSR